MDWLSVGSSFKPDQDIAVVAQCDNNEALVLGKDVKRSKRKKSSKKRHNGHHKSSNTIFPSVIEDSDGSTSDFDDMEGDNVLAISNGADTFHRGHDSIVWEVATRPNKDVFECEGMQYRGEIPKYVLKEYRPDNKIVLKSSSQLAKLAHKLPDGAMIQSQKSTLNKTDQCFQPLKYRTSVGDAINTNRIRMAKNSRYFGSAASQDLKRLRLGSEIDATPKNSKLMLNGSMIPLLPFDSVEAEVSSWTQEQLLATYLSDAELFEATKNTANKVMHSSLRENPGNILGWLSLAAVQRKLAILQHWSTGGKQATSQALSSLATATVSGLQAAQPMCIEKEISILEDAVKKCMQRSSDCMSESANSSNSGRAVAVYQQLLGLFEVQLSPLDFQKKWEFFLEHCNSTELLFDQWQYVQGLFADNNVVSMRDRVASMLRELVGNVGHADLIRRYKLARKTVFPSKDKVVMHELPLRLQEDMEALKIDFVVGNLAVLYAEAGLTERSVALLQAIVDININSSDSQGTLAYYETYWESESTRLGEQTEEGHFVTGFRHWEQLGRVSATNSICVDDSDIIEQHARQQFDEIAAQAAVNLVQATSNKCHDCGVQECHYSVQHDDQLESGEVLIENVTVRNDNYHNTKTGAELKDAANSAPDMSSSSVQYEYSRVHGYRIAVATEQDSSAVYRRLLGMTSDHESERSTTGQESIPAEQNHHDSRKKVEAAPLLAVPSLNYIKDVWLSKCQFQPLRINSASARDAEAAELQPERVAFFEDINQQLFAVSSPAHRTRVLLRALQSLGLEFPLAEHSGNVFCRSMYSNKSDVEGMPHIGHWNTVIGKENCSRFSNNNNDAFEIRALRTIDCRYRTLSASSRLLHQHADSLVLRLRDSPLLFVIRFIDQIVVSNCTVGSLGGLSADDLFDLNCGLLNLHAQKLQVELQTDNDSEGRENSLKTFRMTCQAILQRNESVECGGRQDLSTWLSYVQVEASLGDNKLAGKVCDKLFVSLRGARAPAGAAAVHWSGARLALEWSSTSTSAPTSTSASSAAPEAAQKHELTESEALNKLGLQAELACRIITDITRNGSTDDFTGYFKQHDSKKKKSSKTSASASPLTSSFLCESSRQLNNLLQAKISVLITQLTIAKENTATEKSIGAIRMCADCCPALNLLSSTASALTRGNVLKKENDDTGAIGGNIFHLTCMLAWLQFLAPLSVANSQASINQIDMHLLLERLNVALQSGCQIFQQVYDAICMNMLPPDSAASAHFTSQSESCTRNPILGVTTSAGLGLCEVMTLIDWRPSSPAEAIALGVMEAIHTARLEFLLFARLRMKEIVGVQLLQGHMSLSHLSSVVVNSLKHFPLNPCLLSCLFDVETHRPAGYLRMKCYVKTQQERRLIWGGHGRLCALEHIFEVMVETHHIQHLAKLTCTTSELQNLSTDAYHRICHALENMLTNDGNCKKLPCIWMCYVRVCVSHKDWERAKRLLYRAVSSCWWSKSLWREFLGQVHITLSDKEMSDVKEAQQDKGVFMRT